MEKEKDLKVKKVCFKKKYIFLFVIFFLIIPAIILAAWVYLPSYRSFGGQTIPIKNIYNQERNIVNETGTDYLVPNNTTAEWDAFRTHLPSGVFITCPDGYSTCTSGDCCNLVTGCNQPAGTLIGTCARCTGSSPNSVNQMVDDLSHVYATTLIGTQCWLAEDYKRVSYVAGGAIPQWMVNTSGQGSTNKYTCAADNNNCSNGTDDRFFQRYAAVPTGGYLSPNATTLRGICPTGWHLPSETELTVLKNYVMPYGCSNTIESSFNGTCLNTYFNFGLTFNGMRRPDSGIRNYAGAATFIYTSNWWDPGSYPYNVARKATFCANMISGCTPGGVSNENSAGFSVRCIKDVGGGNEDD